MQTMTKRGGAVAAALAMALTLSACGDGKPDDSPAAVEGPDQSDGRALADWAAVQVVQRNTTEICEYGSDTLKKRLGSLGWCEKDPTFTETVVSMNLIGTCDASKGGSGQTPPGDLYWYEVEPSVTFDPDKGKQDGIQVTVLKQDGNYIVNSIVTKDASTEDMGNPNCPGNEATPTSASISLE